MYSNNYQVLNSAGDDYNCIHTYERMLTFCVTEIIYYIIINSANKFGKSTNKIYHNCVYQGAVYDINQICKAHFNPKPLKCLYMCQLKFAIVTYIVSNIYRTINKSLPNPIIYVTR